MKKKVFDRINHWFYNDENIFNLDINISEEEILRDLENSDNHPGQDIIEDISNGIINNHIALKPENGTIVKSI